MSYNPYGSPRTQYDRNLTLRVVGGGSTVSFTFPIKPGEFQSDYPARVTTTQTLQGVYQDFGGLGVQTLIYQGHTGWRRRAPNAPFDGFQVFQSLYNNIFREFHNRKAYNPNPDSVQCLVIDDLYDTVYDVSLDDFQATKSRSSPLLYNYIIRMTVRKTSPDIRSATDYTGISKPDLPVVQSNTAQVNKVVQSVVQKATAYVPSAKKTYKVVSGDSIWVIAQKYYGNGSQYKKIAISNGIQPPYTIFPGQVLTIP